MILLFIHEFVRIMKESLYDRLTILILMIFIITGCGILKQEKRETIVSIRGDKWYYNGKVINPGYEGAVNTAFNADGSLRDDYMARVEKVISACDKNQAVVNLTCFYQRQHSHFSALSGKESIKHAVRNTVEWIREKRFSNITLEISNEYRHGGFRNWQQGEWLMSEAGQVELIRLAKQLHPHLLVSTSGIGDGKLHPSLIEAADFLLIHFNNSTINEYASIIGELKKYGKPVVCNEDDKINNKGAMALKQSVMNGSGWGYMNAEKNQTFPFKFEGVNDDPEVYGMFSNVTTPSISTLK